MILCQNCKHYDFPLPDCISICKIHEDREGITGMSCPDAERADGIKVCCETCKHISIGLSYDECSKKKWTNGCDSYSTYIELSEMKCDEWEEKQ